MRSTRITLPLTTVLWLLAAGFPSAQNIGDVQNIDLTSGTTTLTLDFTDRDYELILYSAVSSAADTANTYSFTVSGPNTASKPISLRSPAIPPPTDRERLEAELRRRERVLAASIRAAGWNPPARKPQPSQATSRTFTFEAFGNVTQDQSVTATLVASNDRVLAYLDDATESQGKFSASQIQDMIDTFQDVSYPALTSLFGASSDVDGDGRVLFLYTHLVDQVGGVAGFYASSSVVPENLGGDGNNTDMMFIGLANSFDFYKPLLAHEFQHLINYNEHALLRDGFGEESWLNEALSHYSEDIVDGHVEGDLPRLYTAYLETPQIYSLIGPAGLSNGIRGAAYLFLRTLVDDFGSIIIPQLVQTELEGISNVEAATNFDFIDLYRDHTARLFLSGTDLNSSSIFNYSFSFFTDAVTGQRSLPNPREVGIPAAGSPVTGGVRPLSSAFLRLMGDALQVITIDTEVAGDMQGILIPIPRDFQPERALRADFFPALTFDASVPGLYTTGQPVHFSGETVDPDISRLLFQFVSTDGAGREIAFFADSVAETFSEFIIFSDDQIGSYDLEIYGGVVGESLPLIGRFPVVVLLGTEPAILPAAFFDGITLDEDFETVFAAGSPMSFSGMVTNPEIASVQLRFDPLGINEDLIVQTTVRPDGTFDRGYIFEPGKTGDYTVTAFGFDSDGFGPNLGEYSPVSITEPETIRTSLPINFFEDLLLNEPLPARLFAGQTVEVSGQVLDPELQAVFLTLDDAGGVRLVESFVNTEGDMFSLEFMVPDEVDEDFVISIFAGASGQSLFGKGSYSAAEILESQPDILLLNEALSFSETAVGTSSQATLAIDNVGSEALSLSDFAFTGPFATTGNSATIASGERGSVVITFQPTQAGDTTGVFTFASNDPDTPSLSVPLAGSATQPAASVLRVLEQALAFGQVEVGESVAREIRVLNIGSASLSITSITSGNAVFTSEADLVEIASGDTLRVAIVFAPQDTGTIVSVMQIAGNDGQDPTSVVLSGVGIRTATAPMFAVVDTSLLWGDVLIGQEESLNLLVYNPGGETLTLTGVSTTNDFQTTVDSLSVSPGDTVAVPVTFTPAQTGETTGILTLQSNDASNPARQITLLGTGIETAGPPSADFTGDGLVNFDDFLDFAARFGTEIGDSNYSSRHDLTQDGAVDFADFLEFAAAFGKSV